MSDSGMLADPRHRRELRLVVASLVASLGIHVAAVGLVPPVVTGSVEAAAPINVSLRIAADYAAVRAEDGATLDRIEFPAPDVQSEREIAPSGRPAATAQPEAVRVAVPVRRPPPLQPGKVAAAPDPKALSVANSGPPVNPLSTANPASPERLPQGDSRNAPPVLAVAMGPARKAVAAPTTPPRFRADYLSNPPPAYPRRARRDGIEGTVTLKVLVTATGAPGEVKVENSSGSESLDRAALNAVRAWQFVPARRADEAIDAWIRVPVVFRLESG
jgi:periplasmic protein TonB